jgi:hypothetical protein
METHVRQVVDETTFGMIHLALRLYIDHKRESIARMEETEEEWAKYQLVESRGLLEDAEYALAQVEKR